ncbi:FliH/SctL family protein [Holophaga foetida]|uniref:FliH/SctL family protein n=1 Tax=Holophaga foetida TaxID=35839 RepID=UPI000310E5A2|nr:FliH/SctL family protein [Holophaga foetida]
MIRKSQDAQAAIEDRLGTLDQWLKSIPEQLRVELAARLAALEDEMVALSFSAICRVLGEKIVRREVVAAKVRHAIEQCCGSGAYSPLVGLVAIHVHPKDYEGLETDPVLAQWLQKRQGGIPAWVPDDQVRLGGCIVRSSQGSLDARLETELGSLSDLLIQARASVLPAGENG